MQASIGARARAAATGAGSSSLSSSSSASALFSSSSSLSARPASAAAAAAALSKVQAATALPSLAAPRSLAARRTIAAPLRPLAAAATDAPAETTSSSTTSTTATTPARPPVPGLHPTRLLGVGASVPSTVLTNDDLARLVDTNDEWITTRTGIKRRHVLAPGETMTQHAAAAALKALEMAGIAPQDVDMVILCTSTPDDAFGGAGQVQAAIGATSAVAFDLTGACSGFVLGVVTAAQYLRTGLAKRAVVVGADALSRITDWTDRGTCILFGDGCGAVVLAASDAVPEAYAASEAGRRAADKAAEAAAKAEAAAAAGAAAAGSAAAAAPVPAGVRGRGPPGCAILGVDMKSDGRGHKSLNCVYRPPAAGGEGGSDGSSNTTAAAASKPTAPPEQAGSPAQYSNIAMAGQEVFKFAVRSVPAVIDSALDAAGVAKEEIDWLVMHQANARILDAAAQRLGLPAERVVTNLSEYGNTSAASIPLALDEAVRGGKVKGGDLMAMAGFGAGLTWAGAIVRWG